MTDTSSGPAARSLTRAYLWRTTKERKFQLLRFLLPYSAVLLLVFMPRINGNNPGTNGLEVMAEAGYANGIAEPYAANIGGAIQMVPLLAGFLAGIGSAAVTHTFLSTQQTRGEVEILLAARYRARDIVTAVIGLSALLATLLWATTITLGTALIALTLAAHSLTITPDPWYLVTFIALPLLTAICSATIACALCCAVPTFALPSGGNITGGRGPVAALGMTPGILAAVVYIVVPATSIRAGCIGGIVVLTAVTIAAYLIAVTRFQSEKFIGN